MSYGNIKYKLNITIDHASYWHKLLYYKIKIPIRFNCILKNKKFIFINTYVNCSVRLSIFQQAVSCSHHKHEQV